MKILLCPNCKTYMEKHKNVYECPRCSNIMTAHEYKEYEEYEKRREKIEEEVKTIKEAKLKKAEIKGELVHPLTYKTLENKVDPIKVLNEIKSLLSSDSISNQTKEDLKVIAQIFINNHNCTICKNLGERFEIPGIWYVCNLNNDDIVTNTSDYYSDLPICPTNCPVKKYKL